MVSYSVSFWDYSDFCFRSFNVSAYDSSVEGLFNALEKAVKKAVDSGFFGCFCDNLTKAEKESGDFIFSAGHYFHKNNFKMILKK